MTVSSSLGFADLGWIVLSLSSMTFVTRCSMIDRRPLTSIMAGVWFVFIFGYPFLLAPQRVLFREKSLLFAKKLAWEYPLCSSFFNWLILHMHQSMLMPMVIYVVCFDVKEECADCMLYCCCWTSRVHAAACILLHFFQLLPRAPPHILNYIPNINVYLTLICGRCYSIDIFPAHEMKNSFFSKKSENFYKIYPIL